MSLENDRSPSFKFEAEFLASLLKPGDIAVDCNAGVGRVSLALSEAVGEQGGVLAFESQSFLYNILCGNLALNHVLNTQAFNRIIGNQNGRSLYLPQFTYLEEMDFSEVGCSQRIGPDHDKPVACLRIDDLSLKSLRLVRMDLAGYEFEALTGAQGTIHRCQPILYVRLTKNLEGIVDFFKTEKYDWTSVEVSDESHRTAVLAYPFGTDTTEWFSPVPGGTFTPKTH
jgi:FkbM family methyltransferase